MNRTVATVSLIPRVIGIVVSIGFGLFWLGIGISIKPFAREADWFAPMAFGVLALCGGLFGVIRLVMKMRAPVPRDERAPEGSDTLTFDADAAIERYLAQKASGDQPFPVENVPQASRPVFGRKTPPSAAH